MALYAIGDVQGCYEDLLRLLQDIPYVGGRDRLWFTGDLVNRGARSVEVLRFVRDLGESAVTVLGNHDIHLLAIANGHKQLGASDTFMDVLEAPDRDELLQWLRHRPLLHYDEGLDITLIHAGLPPQWDPRMAQRYAREVEHTLRGPDHDEFLGAIYGNEPELWSPALAGVERLRYIVNCLTRLRYCDQQGRLQLSQKGTPGRQGAAFLPWFDVPGRASQGHTIVFGHWSTLGTGDHNGVYSLDGGCVWGGALTALRLDSNRDKNRDSNRQWISTPCHGAQQPGRE